MALQGCQLRWVDLAGWPSLELCSRPGMPVDRDTHTTYLVQLQQVLVDAATALQVVTPPADPPDPDDGLQDLWRRACGRMEIPSTRMLLEGHSTLLSVDGATALVAVDATWLAMVQSRRSVVEGSLAEVLGQPVAVSLIARSEQEVQ